MPVLVKAFPHRYGIDLAERIHTEQSTGALATIAAATDSLELAL
jgi:hypothetical protein